MSAGEATAQTVDTIPPQPETMESLFQRLDLAMYEGDVTAVRDLCSQDLVRYESRYHGDHLRSAIASNRLSDDIRDQLYSLLSEEWSGSVDEYLSDYLRLASSSGTLTCLEDLLHRLRRETPNGASRAAILKGLLSCCRGQSKQEKIHQEIKLAEASA